MVPAIGPSEKLRAPESADPITHQEIAKIPRQGDQQLELRSFLGRHNG